MNEKRAGKKQRNRFFAVLLAAIMVAASFGVGVKETKAAGFTVTLHDNTAADNTVTATGEGYLRMDKGYVSVGWDSSTPFSFSNPGYVITGWNTDPYGKGLAFDRYGNLLPESTSYEVIADMDLYAQWSPAYTITLHENLPGSTNKESISGNGRFYASESYAVFGDNYLNYSSPFGNSTVKLVSWNTDPNGMGTSYAATEEFYPSSDMDLYAQWEIPRTLTIHSNVPGKDDTQSGTLTAGNPVRFYEGASIWLNWDYADHALNGELMYFAYDRVYRPGYAMTGWNTKADGSGDSYAFGTYFLMPASDLDLYAQWVDASTITVHTNTGTSEDFDLTYDLVPGGYIYFDSIEKTGSQYSHMYDPNGNCTNWGIPGTDGYLQNNTMSLKNLNTKADGTGTSYDINQNIYPSGDMDLYMQWEKPYTVILHDNTSANKTETISGNGYLSLSDTSAYFGGNSISFSFKKAGYELSGWNTKADGTGTHYDRWGMQVDEDLELYAEWTKAYTIKLYENIPNSTKTAEVTGTGWFNANASWANFGYGSAGYDFSYSGYTLTSWNTKADGTGTEYSLEGAQVNQDLELYAQWTKSVNIVLHDNTKAGQQITAVGAGKAELSTNSCTFGGNYTSIEFTNAGFYLSSWNTKADGSGTAYPIYVKFDVTGDMDLYAQWVPMHKVTVSGDLDGSGTLTSKSIEVPEGAELQVGRVNNSETGMPYVYFMGYYTFPGSDTSNSFGSESLIPTRTDAVFSHLEDAAGNKYIPGVGDYTKTYGPITGNLDLTMAFSSDMVKVTYVSSDPAGIFGESETDKYTVTIARGTAAAFAYIQNCVAVGYTENPSTEEYFDKNQFNQGEVIIDKDTTFYSVYAAEDAFMFGNTSNPYDAASGFYYTELNNNTLAVTGYNGPLENARIPESINGKNVSIYCPTSSFADPAAGEMDTSVKVKSLVYPDYIPHLFPTELGATFFAYRYKALEAIIFEGTEAPEVSDNMFSKLTVNGFYPSAWTSVPSSTFGGAKHITWMPMVDEPVVLRGNSLTLNGDIGVNFYLEIPAYTASKAVVHFTFKGQTTDYTVSDLTLETTGDMKGYYKFTVETVAKEMRDEIVVTVTDKTTGAKLALQTVAGTDVSSGYNYSVEKYLELAEGQSASQPAAFTAVVKAMDNYGKYAQNYFNYGTAVTPDAAAIANVTETTLKPYEKTTSGTVPAGIAYYGSSLTLEAETSYNHYFTLESGHTIDEYRFTLAGETVTPEKKGSYYRVTKADIPAAELDVMTDLVVQKADGTGDSLTISYCPLSYAYSAVSKNAASADVSKALYNYHVAAKAYFA